MLKVHDFLQNLSPADFGSQKSHLTPYSILRCLQLFCLLYLAQKTMRISRKINIQREGEGGLVNPSHTSRFRDISVRVTSSFPVRRARRRGRCTSECACTRKVRHSREARMSRAPR